MAEGGQDWRLPLIEEDFVSDEDLYYPNYRIIDPQAPFREVARLMENSAYVARAMQMGFSRDVIRDLLRSRIRHARPDFGSHQAIISALIEWEEEHGTEENELNTVAVMADEPRPASSEGQPMADRDAIRENVVRMEKERRCKICLDKESDVVFIPCQHLCCCKDCAERLRETSDRCPICRRRIEKAIMVYYE